MLGSFRFALALTVAVYHSGFTPFGWQIGVSAVVAFYVISGYAISGLVTSKFPSVADIPRFYMERVIRLGPQYYIYLALSALMVLGFGITSNFTVGKLTSLVLFAHLTVVPLLLLLTRKFTPDGNFVLNPPAWSLGTEACFYAIFPWLLLSRTAVYTAASFGFIVLHLATAGILDPDRFGYRLIFGVIVFFLAGHFIQTKDWRALGVLCALLIVNFYAVNLRYGFTREYNWDIYRGALLGIVGVLAVIRLPGQRIDAMLGNVSYGLYLAHFPILLLLGHCGIDKALFGFPMIVAGLATVSGFVTYWFVERPTLDLRRSWR